MALFGIGRVAASPSRRIRSAIGSALIAWTLTSCGDPKHGDELVRAAAEAGVGVPTTARGDAGAAAGGTDASVGPMQGGPAQTSPGRAAEAGTEAEAGAALDAGGGADATVARGDAATPNGPADSGSDARGPWTSGSDCSVPELPAVAQLTPYAKHPDPFKMLDGSRITRRDQWRCRRAEIEAQLEQYESGPKPDVAPDDVRATWSGNTLSITTARAGKSVQFKVDISRPSSAGTQPIPLLIAFSFMTLDSSVFAQNGVATLVFQHDALGAQSGGSSRGTGLFYDLYGKDHPASSMVAWAWGVSRILDALEKTPEANIDPKRVAVTGCSRYGKGALLAGALDERVALTIPQESGAGGSASWRVSQAQSTQGINVQTLSNAANEQPWFRASFGPSFGGNNVTKLPFDHHMVLGLVAPRPLLVIDNAIDWLGIDSSFTSGSIAHAIWEALGIPDRMAYSQSRNHTHCQFPAEQRAILDAYVKKFLVGTGDGNTRVLEAASAKADLNAWMDWTVPTLQ